MKNFFSVILKVLGYILTLTLIIGGSQVFMRDFYFYTSDLVNSGIFLLVCLFYLGTALLCFWGSKRLKKNKNHNTDMKL
jgi:hypothetical protein